MAKRSVPAGPPVVDRFRYCLNGDGRREGNGGGERRSSGNGGGRRR